MIGSEFLRVVRHAAGWGRAVARIGGLVSVSALAGTAQVAGDAVQSGRYLFAERKPSGAVEQRVAAALGSVVKLYGASGLRGIDPYASGVVISDQGHILTLDLVIFEKGKTRVVLADGSIHYAELFPSDDAHGVRIVKIDVPAKPKMEPAKLVPRGAEPVPNGTFVVSVGNSFRLAEFSEKLSATFGVVSGRASSGLRYRLSDVEHEGELILTDAANNPGHYGGGLFTLDGRLLGIHAKLVESRETNTQISAAIPIASLHDYIDLCLGRRKLGTDPAEQPVAAPPFHGIVLFAKGRRSPPAYVDRTLPNSPGRRAGLRPDDLIVRVDQHSVRSCAEFDRRIAKYRPGQTVELTYKRGTRVRKVKLELETAR